MASFQEYVNAINNGSIKIVPRQEWDGEQYVTSYIPIINGQEAPNSNDVAFIPQYAQITVNQTSGADESGNGAYTYQVQRDDTSKPPIGFRLRGRTDNNLFQDVNVGYNSQTGAIPPPQASQFYTSGEQQYSGLAGFAQGLGQIARDTAPVWTAALGANLGAGAGLFGDLGAAGAMDAATLADLQLGQAMTANAAGAAGGAGSAAYNAALLDTTNAGIPSSISPNAYSAALTDTTNMGGAGGAGSTTGLPTTGSPSSVSPSLLSTGASVAKGLLSGAGGIDNTALSNLISGGLQTAGGLLQTQASKEAALKAQQDIINATQTGVASSQFRPVGVTTAFGTSNFKTDPVTGQLISAGYTPSSAISQGVSSLTGLGQKYLAQSPEDVANQYMLGQQNLLAPTRERQLAAIRNQLQNTGRTGLSIGGTGLRPGGGMGLSASNPELEAYYNAIAQQDATLAANAQTAGQQNVNFGAGLFTQAGGLEQLAQQPLSLGAQLGGQAANYGANAGRLGLTGAVAGATYGTGSAATNNPYASLFTGLGNPTSTLGTGLMNWLTTNPSTTQPTNALNTGAYGTGLTGYENAMADIYGTGSTSNLNYFGQPTQYSAY
ncbi:hypothetical protein UFOVP1457_34 [uncultured Caudovirales phage]|uniref:Uncharacterized protein n=1 Tax=uncultured Caudovirales phage TaxID=2100421 RepID=A0A6J5SIF1_9CAUD|nr:hypothetical protein UFOVP1457_34 [uncultured Caudovirales phage]